MKILIANVGSSTLKCQLLEMPSETLLARAKVERIGEEKAPAEWTDKDGKEHQQDLTVTDYTSSIRFVLDQLTDPKNGTLTSLSDLGAVGFKPVIAKGFTGCQYMNDEVLAAMEYSGQYHAPLHNDACITAVNSFKSILPKTPLLGLFETAFFQEWPEYAMQYGIPWDWTEKYDIRRRMGHGASHRYVNRRVAELLGKKPEDFNSVQFHLGGSSSLTAVRKGVTIDGTAGFTMQVGVPQSVRNGDLDGFMVTFLADKEKKSHKEIINRLMNEGGLSGISGMGFDMRDLQEAAEKGHERAKLAVDTYVYQLRKYLGSFLLVMGQTDVITFAGGTGEASEYIRERVLENTEFFGIKLDKEKNKACFKKEGKISRDDSRVEIWVVPTNEEIVVARECVKLLEKEKS